MFAEIGTAPKRVAFTIGFTTMLALSALISRSSELRAESGASSCLTHYSKWKCISSAKVVHDGNSCAEADDPAECHSCCVSTGDTCIKFGTEAADSKDVGCPPLGGPDQ